MLDLVKAIVRSAIVLGLSIECGFAQTLPEALPPVRAQIGQVAVLDPTDGYHPQAYQSVRPQWVWVQRPSASVSDFSDASALRPSFTPDVPGTYKARVDFYDTAASSGAPAVGSASIEVGTGNLTPIARIQGRGAPGGTSPMALDATASYDVNGDFLTYSWTVEASPPGSNPTLLTPTAPFSALKMDVGGIYTVGLRVQDTQGALSDLATYEVKYLPYSGRMDVYRVDYDETVVGTANSTDAFGLGNRDLGPGQDTLVQEFALSVPGAANVDSLTFQFDGATHVLSTPADILAFIDILHQDASWLTEARISADSAGKDLTFQLGSAGGSITLENVIGSDLTRASLQSHWVGNYEGAGGRRVAPVTSATFDQLRAPVGGQVRLEARGSTDLDGSPLWPEGYVSVTPPNASLAYYGEAEGVQVSILPAAGDYLVAMQTSDSLWKDVDQVLVSVGPGASVRPVARIAPISGTLAARAMLDGTQSFDFDGDALSYQWALLTRPASSTATIVDNQAPEAGLVPDVVGLYVVQLQVSDARQASVPVTFALNIGAPLPQANAGPDRLTVGPVEVLNGSTSVGTGFAWSALDLSGVGAVAVLNNATSAQATMNLPVRQSGLNQVLETSIVYQQMRSDLGGLCAFDTGRPADIMGADISEALAIALVSKGQRWMGGSTRLVWTLQNSNDFSRLVELRDSADVVYGSWQVPGQTVVYLTTPEIATGAMYAAVDSVDVANATPNSGNFDDGTTVCAGAGAQVAQLIVQQAGKFSLPDTVFVGNGNLRPILQRSARLTPDLGALVSLTAQSVASDPNADTMTHDWALLYRPQGSNVTVDTDPAVKTLAGPTLSFTPDRNGIYLIQLTARDAQYDAIPVVFVVEVHNSTPIAVASIDGPQFVGDVATLDGTQSYDPDSDALTFAWSVTQRPASSVATIIDSTTPSASFTPDRPGDYTFSLVVSDGSAASQPAIVTLEVPNRAPLAVLQGPATLEVGSEAILSATGSSDPDSDPLSYIFAIASAPAGAPADFVDLGGGQVQFEPNVAGSYVLRVTVSDGVASAEADWQVVVHARNAAPVLGDLDPTYTVELGLQLALPLTATDPDGDPISFFASSLPLPRGVSLNATTGALLFRPEAGQLGSYTLTLGVSDGKLTDTGTITIQVVAASAGQTAIHGRVLDAVDFANGIETPLANMPVRLRNAALSTVTDANGQFSFGSLTKTIDEVLVEPTASGGPGGYLGQARNIQITSNQNRDLSPEFLLTPLNDGCANVVAGAPTLLTGTASGVNVSIPADTIKTTAGAAYTGQVCLGSLPELFAQPGLPEDTNACRIYALSAPGAVFSQPISVQAPNVDGLPEQTSLNLWQMANAATNFRRVAGASVGTGAATVNGQIMASSEGMLFTFLPQPPKTIASGDQPTGNSQLTVFQGDLSETYALPGYRAFNQGQQVALAYHSKSADPTVIAAGDVTIAATASLPQSLTTKIQIGGLALSDLASWNPRLRSDGYAPALVGQALTLRQSMPIDGTGLASGRYNYDFVAKAKYGCSTVSATHRAEVHIQNTATSPYGNGWSVDGLQKLTLGEDGKAAIIDDQGVSTFDPEPTLSQFDNQPIVFPTVGTQSVSVVDYDNDGNLDVVYAESGTGNIGLIHGAGGRELMLDRSIHVATPNAVPLTGIYPPNLLKAVTGDLNKDGSPDIAFGIQDTNTQTTSVIGFLLNNGQGEFQNPGLRQPNSSSFHIRDLAVIDIDKDGYADLPYLNQLSENYTEIYGYFGNATGTFPTSGAVPTVNLASNFAANPSGAPLQFQFGDVDGDGRVDIAYRRKFGGVYFDFQNTVPRKFTYAATNLGASPIPLFGDFFQLVDLNNDGKLDILWSGSDNLSVFMNANTTGRTFNAAISLPRPPFANSSMSVHVADTNGDGTSDIILSGASNGTSGGVAVYVGNGDGTFAPFETGLVNYNLNQIAFADINKDGSLDMVSGQRFSVTVHFSNPTASGKFVSGKGEYSTLSRLADGSYERRYKDGTKVLFNAQGLQTAEVDAQGNIRSFAYDADGRLASITDQVGGETEFVYDDSLGRLSLIHYPDGRETAFDYDDTGNLVGVQEPETGTVSFAYDANNRLISTTNQNGNTSEYSYDATGQMNGATLPDASTIRNQVAASLGLVDGLGDALTNPLRYIAPENRVTKVTDRKGQITEIIVNEFGATTQVTDPLGRVTKITRDSGNLAVRVERPSATGGVRIDEIEYDAVANVTSMTESVGTPQARTTAYEYEPQFNKVTSMVAPGGFATTYAYNTTGEVTQITDPEGGLRQFSYLPDGLLASRTDENGNLTAFVYNAAKNLSQITYADGSTTAMSYDTRGNATLIAEADGLPEERQIQRTYDLHNRIRTVETTAGDGAQIDGLTTYAYDLAGNLASVTDQSGLVTAMTYDPMERLVAVQDPAEGLIQRSYNAAGEVTEHTNGDGEINHYAYDAISRLTQTTDPEGYVKSFAYDARDNVTSVTDGQGGITTFTYDRLDRMLTRTNPVGETMSRAYDGRDNLTALTREDGSIETATYDGLSRRTQVATAGNTLTYAFDDHGNLIAAADNDSGVTFTYDTRNRLATTTTDGTVGPQPAVTLSYTYDALDRRLGMTDSLGGSTAYAWDAQDRLASLTAPWATVYSFGYDGEGRRTALTSTSGRATSYGYTNGLLTALTHAQSGVTLTDLAYSYGPDGQLTAILDNLEPTKSKDISYDALNRLVQVAEGTPVSAGGVPIPVEDYAYDGEGNRTASHLSAAYASNDHNQLLEDDSYTYAYDAKGNRISRTAKAGGAVETYSYDSQNRLIGYTNGTTTASYAYDAMDRRIAKTVDGVTEAFVYDTADFSDSTTSNSTLTFRAGQLLRRWLFGPQTDEPLAFESYTTTTAPGSGSAIELFANRLGSIITAVSVSTGAIAAEYDYDSYGIRTIVGALEQPYGYTGREHDAESGLIYLRARAYDPQTGLFLQVDPTGFSGGQANLYAYVSNSPENFLDPSGLAPSLVEFKENVRQATINALGATGRVSSGTLNMVADIIDQLTAVIDAHNSFVDVANRKFSGMCHSNDGRSTKAQTVYGGAKKGDGVKKVGVANAKRALRRYTEQNLKMLERVVLFDVKAQVAARAYAYAIEKAVAVVLRALSNFEDHEWKHLDLDCHKQP